MNPKITLAMPIYNVEAYVERALRSALNQTYDNIEFILVDDKGSDDSMEVVRRVVESHERGAMVRIIDHGTNRGTGATKNSAIESATGEYIYFMDSDDEISTNCIERLYAKMAEQPVDLVVGGYSYVGVDGSVIYDRRYVDGFVVGDGAMAMNQYCKGAGNVRLHVQTWNKLYRLSFLKDNDITCVASQQIEDNIFTSKVIFAAQSCGFIPDVTYRYFERVGSTVHSVQNRISERFADQLVDVAAYYKRSLAEHREDEVWPYYRKKVELYLTYVIVMIELGGFDGEQRGRYRRSLLADWPMGGVCGAMRFRLLVGLRYLYEVFMPKRIKQSLGRS